MSFLSALKHSLGFGRDEEFDELDDDPVADSGSSASTETADHSRWMPPTTAADDTPGELFNAVVELFNRWSPAFVSECIDTERQRRYIYDSLSAELRARLDRQPSSASVQTAPAGLPAVAPVATVGDSDRDAAAARMADEISRLRAENAKTASLRDALEQARLSAERQKTALTDRIHALSEQLRAAEEKNEKMALAAATGSSATSRQARHEAELKELTDKAETLSAEAAKLREENETLRGEGEKLRGELESATARVSDLTVQNEQFAAKSKMSDQMLSELNSRCGATAKELEQARAEIKRQKEEIAEQERQIAEVEELGLQMEKVEELLAAKDARIADLQKRLSSTPELEAKAAEAAELRTAVERLRADKESLRKTIETNLYNQAHSENRLRSQVKKLQTEIERLSGSPDAPKPRKRRKSADNPREGDETSSAEDFGYKAPAMPRHRDDDAQMSLF